MVFGGCRHRRDARLVWTQPIVPVDYRESRDRCKKIRDARPLERSDIHRAKIGAAEGDARHPGSYSSAGREQNVMIYFMPEESLLERIDLFRIALVEQNLQIARRRKDKQFVGINQRAPEITKAVESDSVRPRALAQTAGSENLPLFAFPFSSMRRRVMCPPMVSTT